MMEIIQKIVVTVVHMSDAIEIMIHGKHVCEKVPLG